VALTGRAVLLAALGVVPAVLVDGWAGVAAWALAVVALAALDVALAGSPRALRLVRRVPGRVRLGEQVEVQLTVANEGTRRVRGVLRDAWPPSAGALDARHRVDLPAGERRRLTTTLQPTRRGDRVAGAVTVRSVGPLGVAARQASLPVAGRVRVLPPFDSRKHLPAKLARLRELDGRASIRVRGQGTEFDSLRDYVEGDDVRSVDWRATARRQQVVVRTWRPERDRRVLLVLDTSRTAAGRVGAGPRLDAAMDAALLLAALASRAGDRVDLLAYDRRVRAQVAGAGRTELLPAVVEAMAPLEADLVEADWTGLVAAVRARVSQRALVVLLTPMEATAVEEGLLTVVHRLTAMHRVVVASVSDPEVEAMARRRGDAAAVYDAAAAERALLDRELVASHLARLGVEVVDAPPADLPPRLADRYLALKAAGRL
jgi:uncharacterized protein (DUF58 family)